MMIYCRKEEKLAELTQNQLRFLEDGHQVYPYGCSACREWLCDYGNFEGDGDHIVVTTETMERLLAAICEQSDG